MHGSYFIRMHTVFIKKQLYLHQTLYGAINKLISCPHVFFCIIKIIIEGKPTAQGITGLLVSRHMVVCHAAKENGAHANRSKYINRNNKVAIFMHS